MVGSAKKKKALKQKHARVTRQTVRNAHARDTHTKVGETCQDGSIPIDENLEPNLQQKNIPSMKEVIQEDEPISEDSFDEVDQEDEPMAQESAIDSRGRKKTRGPTKMKDIAVEPGSRVHVDFTDKGEPCGAGSISLSSYLGPLVREHVPVTLSDWRKLDDGIKVVLWKSIQARFDLDQEWQKAIVFKSMGCIWRASKSRLVSKIQAAKNKSERLQLKPKNIQNRTEWKRFVRAKTSTAFKAVSEKYRAIRRKQIPHTCSRKGMARLAEDMKKNSSDPSSVSRVKIWIKSRTRKDGKPVNTQVSETIEKLNQIEGISASSSTTSVRDDALSKVLGEDKPGRLRGMGRGMTITKLTFFQTKDKYVAKMQEEHSNMQERINHLENLVNKLVTDKIGGEADKTRDKTSTAVPSAEHQHQHQFKKKCKLLDWSGTEEIVAEGCWISSDPKELVNQIPLGPNAMKVWVDIPNIPDAFLWRPTSNMTFIQQAQGKTVAWPVERVIMQMDGQSEEQDNMSGASSMNTNSKKKCKLLDANGSGQIVAEGRWSSSDPDQLVHFVPLGPNAMRVWVDTPKVPTASLWRPTSELEFIEDAVGTTVAWPIDKVLML
ncbi:hypothetical protein M0R45_008938 [Rubus argutus]|uniref:DUF8039 domain-containing protein n=1 Tax=Rubus argutus TaxID=59490 RepID=A0AAW1Y370_RUBAR